MLINLSDVLSDQHKTVEETVRLEMEEIARLLGGEVLRDIPREQFETELPSLQGAGSC